MADKFEFQVPAKDFKKRLDEFLFAEFPFLSRMYLRELVRDRKCEVNGEWKSRGYLLRTGDFIEIEVDRADRPSLQPEPIPVAILFEDAEFLVADKPAGMLVHPTVRIRSGTLLNALAHHLNLSPNEDADFRRAGLVHRLDKDTSGLIVIAKNARSHRILASHFQRRLVEKRYLALVAGTIDKDAGTIDAPIGRYDEQRFWNIKPDGKKAVTNFWVRERFPDRTLLELEPVTGRTNQLRIHLAHIEHPIVGDKKYGGPEHERLCLHAARLVLWHPNGSQRMEFESFGSFGSSGSFGRNVQQSVRLLTGDSL
ncbi:MAG: RluA family pseudouridine synthase [Acidobacteria bacterium]|nr:RluA family pseudouridine synthase [Acidobacteriota bacterium]